jgi:site-specific recombinase XerD
VFTTQHGVALDAANVRKLFKRVCKLAGIGGIWTPRELRTSFVSLMSHRGVSIEEIAVWSGTPPPGPPRLCTAGNCGR